MTIYRNYKKFFISFTTCYFTLSIAAQKQITNDDQLFSRNHISFSLLGGLTSKARITAQPDMYSIGSSAQINFEGGPDYYWNFSKKYSIIIGLHAGGLVRNFAYYIPKEEFTPPTQNDIYSDRGISQAVSFFGRLLLGAERRWPQKRKHFWKGGAGVSLLYTPLNLEEFSAYIIYPNGQQVNYSNMYLIPNNNHRPWLNYHVEAGLSQILKNNNLLSFQLICTLSMTDFVKGYFRFNIPGQPLVNGTYRFNGSFVGLKTGYIFTFKHSKRK